MRDAITTPELFRLLSLSIGKENPATPYMVAKVLGVAATTSGDWAKGFRVMDEKHADQAAQMLGLDREWVQLSLEAERKERAGLAEIAAMFRRAALSIEGHAGRAVAGFMALALLPYLAAVAGRLCILCKTSSGFFEARRPAPRPRPGPLFRISRTPPRYNFWQYPLPPLERVFHRPDAAFSLEAVTQ